MTDARALLCPVHANCAYPCRFVRALQEYPRDAVDAAIEGIADCFDDEGQRIWWRGWMRLSPADRSFRLGWAATLDGMVAT